MIKRLLTNRKRRQDFRSSVFWIVLLLLFAASGMSPALAQYGYGYLSADNATITSQIDKGYIEFQMPVYRTGGDNKEGIELAHLSVHTDGDSTNCVSFYTMFTKDLGYSKEGKYEFQEENSPKDGIRWVKLFRPNEGPDQSGTSFVSVDGTSGWEIMNGNDNNRPNNHQSFDLPVEARGKDLTTTILNLRWYLPARLAGKDLTFKLWVKLDYYDDSKGYAIGTKVFPTIKGTQYTPPTLSHNLSGTQGNYSVTYSGITTPNEGSKIKWDNDAEVIATGITGNKDFLVKNQTRKINFKYLYFIHSKGGSKGNANVYMEKSVSNYSLPPFRQAQNINFENLTGGDTRVFWEVDNSSDADFGAGNFEVQRSTDEGFAKDVKTVGKVQFLQGTNSYTLEDKSGEDNLNGTVYYRIRRDAAAQWGWEFAEKANITKSMHHRGIASATAALNSDGSGVTIKWILENTSNDAVWTDGSQVIIERSEVGGGSPMPIPMAKDATSYEDKNVQLCHEYLYNVFVRPGSKSYPNDTESKLAVSSAPLIPRQLAEVTSVTASKGYFSNYTRVEWTADDRPVEQFLVQRAVYGSNTYQTAGTVDATVRLFDDKDGNPGVVYEYRVVASSQCNKETTQNISKMTDRGFRSPTGAVSGQITFKYGDAVQGVDVRVSGSNLKGGNSLNFGGSADSYLETDNTIDIPDQATLQAYLKPTTTNQTVTILEWGRYRLGLQNGKIAFSANSGTGWATADKTLPTDKFSQVTAIHTSTSLEIYVDAENAASLTAQRNVAEKGSASKVTIGKSYAGYVDEVRLWSRALTTASKKGTSELRQTFDRLLVGNEDGLTAYWRFNDPVKDEFYDISYVGEVYHANHGKIHSATLSGGTEEIPTDAQLCLRGLTDASGFFFISGIPYVGDGTTVELTPYYPGHTFEPGKQQVVINSTQPSHSNINFKNNSAILVSGSVFFENSSIPVKDATFEIDGAAVIVNGELYRSTTDGSFEFSVPVGQHTVRVVKANHTFRNNGRLVDSNGQDLNYQQSQANLRFWDQTKVKLIGRVAGGTVEENKPVGFSLSKNNLGDKPVITLELLDNSSYIYDKNAVYDEKGIKVENAPEKMDSTMTHWNQAHSNIVSYQQSQITISPDGKTGEYVAWLYPTEYKVKSVLVTGWDDLLGSSNLTLDMSNVFTEQTSEYTPVDENGKEKAKQTLVYNRMEKFIKRVDPSISYKQGNERGAKVDYFGLPFVTIPDLKGLAKPDTLVLYDKASGYLFKDGNGNGLPVFSVGTWGFHIEATEDYVYNKQTGADAKVDRVPTQSGDVSITNTFNQNAKPQTAKLDDEGRLYVGITMDKPLFASNEYGHLDISVTIDGKKYTATQLQGFLLGADPQTDGLDFVTAGPITLLNILRDPPGSASYSWWESGQSYSYYTMNTSGFTNVGTEGEMAKLGVKTATGIGIGAMVLTETDIENNIQASINHEETTNHPDARTMTVTTNSRYQTSDDPLNVGSAADVFIGFSNNIYYGAVNEIELLDEATYKGKGGTSKEVYATAVKDGKTYYICKGSNLNVSISGSTLFSYAKMHIENILIPNLETLRNNLLYAPGSITKAEAQSMANAQKRVIYLSKVSKEDETFGSPESYEAIIPSTGVPEEEQVDNFLTKLLGKQTTVKDGTPDSVSMYNNAIKEWVRVLKQNEDEKLAAIEKQDLVDRNRSFHAAAPVEYSESFEMAKEDGYSFEFTATAGVAAEFGFTLGGAGLVTTIDQQFGGVGADEQNSTEGETASAGFVLADEGDFDYISVDVLRGAAVDTTFKQKWDDMYGELKDFNDEGELNPGKLKECVQYGNFIFKTRGGATACPYEPAEYTQYQDGTQKLLNEATLQIERPSLEVDKPVVTNVPSDQAAVYNLKLMNDSQVSGATAIFTIAIVDAANQKGAKFSIDGVPLGEGRGIEVPYGEVMNKVLEVRRGTEYDYENLALVLRSQCQWDPTDNQPDIADTVYISAHFIPSSSDINIKVPTDKWTLNTQSALDSTSGKYYMPLTIDGFDVNFTGFDHIEVQYKPSSGSDKDWTNICSFFNDSVPYKAASGEKAMIEGATISTRFYGAEDQKYDIRAVTFSKVGNEFVTKSSPIISGVKDTKRPVVFGNIQPADGVLGIEDEIRLNFNEEIAEGYMTDVKNFQVTAIRNGSQGDHSTSLTFNGDSAYLATQAERNLTNKDLTVEMWVLPAALGQEMTLFSHGTSTNSLVLSIGADKSVKVRIGDKEYTSRPQDFKTTDWAHVAMSYKASNRQLSAYFGGIEVIAGVQTDSYTGSGPMLFGRDMKGGNFFAGKMHEARVWNKVVSPSSLVANKLTIYTGKELGMLAYYPMTEGKGDKVTDKAQGATAWIYGAEWSTLDGLSVAFKGDTILTVNSSRIPLTDEQDYTLEFWFKAFTGQKDAALVSNGKGLGEENNTSYNKVFVGFVGGKLVFRNNDHEEEVAGHWADGNWHHFAVSVNRNAGNAQIFMDGVLNTYFDAGKLGGFSATELNLGARRWTEAAQMVDHTDMYLKGQVDELQLWNMALPSTYIGNNYNVCPKGTEMGLMAYLPFSKYITNSANVKEMVFSGEDVVTDSTLVADGSKFVSTEKAPVRAKGPEVDIPFTFVVNKDALVINLMDTPEALEKTIVNFTVKEVSDLNGNLMQSPVTWSAYINRNQLKWSKASVTKEKKLYAQMSFTVDVENQGGTEKNFTIEGLPAWLSAEPMYGTIDPLGTQTINFTVDEGTNVGRYDEVVYVKGDNNVSEALPVTLKVFDEQPDWTVDPADFKYNMNIYGKLRVNRLFSTDAEDMIAAFDSDGRCVGVANNQYLKTNDMWYVFMTVYGNSMTGDKLDFRVWDASTGLVYDAYSSETISFKSDDVKGSAMSPIVFDAEERVIQNIGLKEGWNWISFNVASELLSDPEGLFKKLNFEGDELVKDETTATFSAYDPVAKDWVGDPVKLDNQHMFLLQSPVNQKLSVSGVAIHDKDSLTLDIAKGWNYISYLPTVNLPIVEALNGYEAKDGDIIKSQNAFSMYGSVTGWLGSLNYLEPGKGYMLSSAVAGKLVYPDMSAGGGLRSDSQTRSASMTEEPVYPDNRYEANMSVVATIAENLPVHTGDKLLAYSKGELRGAATLTENPENGTPLYFITVGGTGNETVSFALERNGEIIAQTSPVFDYRAHNVQGSIEQPVILDFMNDLQISVYPNPFERELNFVMNTAPGDKVEIYLYTLAGQMMYRHAETCVAGGYLHHRWVCNEELARTVYMAVVVVNGQKNVYKVRRK